MHQTVYSILIIINARKNMIHAHCNKKGTQTKKQTTLYKQPGKKTEQTLSFNGHDYRASRIMCGCEIA